MLARWKSPLPMALVAALLVVAAILLARSQPAQAQRGADSVAGPRYTVIDTEGHNLIVTDNQSNTLYFYTIDKEKEIGSELHLRGTLDLNQVGKPTLKPQRPKSE